MLCCVHACLRMSEGLLAKCAVSTVDPERGRGGGGGPGNELSK